MAKTAKIKTNAIDLKYTATRSSNKHTHYVNSVRIEVLSVPEGCLHCQLNF